MLWIRGLIFTLLVPCVVGGLAPSWIYDGSERRGGFWDFGWVPVAGGIILYLLCLFRFLVSGGTPAIFFTRYLGFLIGEEPGNLVQGGLYRVSRNPMYVGVLMAVFGQAILFASFNVALYGFALWFVFHIVVVFLEEPHLRKARGSSYDEYLKRVPRWLGWPR
jgi:protein-S-isoprenylcysteine O-methyltransferase Ste14